MRRYFPRVLITAPLVLSALSVFGATEKIVGDERWVFRQDLSPAQEIKTVRFTFRAPDEKGWTCTSVFKKNEERPHRIFLEKKLNFGREGYAVDLSLGGPMGPADWEVARKAYYDLCQQGSNGLDFGTVLGSKQKAKQDPGEWNQSRNASGHLLFDCTRLTEWFGPGPKSYSEEITLVKQTTDEWGVDVRYTQSYFKDHRDPRNREKVMKIVESIKFNE